MAITVRSCLRAPRYAHSSPPIPVPVLRHAPLPPTPSFRSRLDLMPLMSSNSQHAA